MPRKPGRMGGKRLSRKVSKVRREDPSLTSKQAVGKAAGILRSRDKKRRPTTGEGGFRRP